MQRRDTKTLISAFSLWALLFSAPALAYLDPGTGSIILQGILAAIAAVAVTARFYWHRVLRFFGLGRNKSAEQDKQ